MNRSRLMKKWWVKRKADGYTPTFFENFNSWVCRCDGGNLIWNWKVQICPFCEYTKKEYKQEMREWYKNHKLPKGNPKGS
jgi:hypothetical protein